MIRSAVHILKKYVTLKRFINASQVLSSYFLSKILRKPILFGQPFMLMIEPTNECNLNCPLCPTGSNTLTRSKGAMPLEHFIQCIDEVSDSLLFLSLWNVGEPFMNDDLIEMIQYAKGKNIYVMTSTNGHFFNDAKRVRELIRSGLDELILSMDGASEETYKRYRQKGHFQKVIDGLNLLIQEKKSVGSKTPVVDLQFIVMRHNEHEIERMEALAREVKVDKLTLKTVHVTSDSEAEAFLPVRKELRRYVFHNGHLSMKGKLKKNCRWLWFCPVINWDGTVVPCCFDKDNTIPLGNVFQGNTLHEIWCGEKYNRLRRRLLSARNEIDLCTNCSEGLKSLYLKSVRLG